MKKISRIFRKVLSLVLSFAVILPATLSLVGDSGSAQALTSLPYIEELKQTNTTFNILEIVPAAGQGSIGYYIAGQEPCANWPTWAADSANATSPATRESYVNDTVFAKLISAGMLSKTADEAPLYQTAAYDEVFPWVAHDGYTKLTLNHTEQTTATGTFTPSATGEYTQSKEFTYASGGDYVQVIKYFSKDYSVQSGDKYYYTPTYDVVGATVENGTAIYTNNGSAFVYFGTTGTSDFPGMETIGTTYYYVTGYTAPSSTTVGLTDPYVAVSDAYRLKTAGETGYFNIDPSKLIYTYVGTGNGGTYSFTPGSGVSNNIAYTTVFYTGGYINNNWFLRFVLDYSTAADTGTTADATPSVKLKVTSLVGSSANVLQYVNNTADLIVLSNGFNPFGDVTAYSTSSDITLAVSSAITAAVEKTDDSDLVFNMPVIVDNRLVGSAAAPQLGSLATDLKNGNSKSTFVSSSVFFFAPDTIRTALATKELRTLYNPVDYYVTGSAFYDAYDVIVYENFIRTQEDATATPLEPKINLARAIRYIINYAEQRVKGQKSSISILFLAPTKPTDAQISALKTSAAGWTSVDEANISVTPMSTLEFVGKNDDLTENYDIIYVGDNDGSNSGLRLNGSFLYANIGSSVDIRESSIGLTDAEYSNTKFYQNYYKLLSTPSTRYSGNDLSTKKLASLKKYAFAGHPVIIDADLTTGSVQQDVAAATFGAYVTGTPSGTSATFEANVVLISGELPIATPKYQWYYCWNTSYINPTAINGATNSTYTPSNSNTNYNSPNYYCTISYNDVNGITSTAATSNNVSFSVSGSDETQVSSEATAETGNLGISNSYSIAMDYYSVDRNNNNKYTFTSMPRFVPGNWWNPNVSKYRFILNRTYNGVTSQVYQTTTSNNSLTNYYADSSLSHSSYCDYYWTLELLDSNNNVISTVNSISSTYRVTWYSVTNWNGKTSWYPSVTKLSSPPSSDGSFNVPVSFSPSMDYWSNAWGGSLTHTMSAETELSVDVPSGVTMTYTWYEEGNTTPVRTSSITTTSTYTSDQLSIADSDFDYNVSHKYYCLVTATSGTSSASAKTDTYVFTRTVAATTITNNGGAAPTGSITAAEAQYFTINTSKVDNSSNMFTFLYDIRTNENVMQSSNVNSETLLRYLNLSKPKIVFADSTKYPTVYARNESTNEVTGKLTPVDGVYTLRYEFTIENDTDTTPTETEYYCNLYIDSDSDGRYISQERIGSIVIREAPDAGETEGPIIESGKLKTGQTYIVTRQLPADRVGFIPWKLEVIKVSNEDVHASVTNYTYVPPDGNPEIINVLQINTGRTSSQTYGYGTSPYGGLPLDTTTGTVPTAITSNTSNSYTQRTNIANSWTTIYNLLQQISSDYEINIQTITTTQANNISSSNLTNTLITDDLGNHTSYSDISSFLYSYDMVLIGFDDAYNELSQATSAAIVDYLENNHPILYTHDSTSLANVPKIYMDYKNIYPYSNCQAENNYYYGYYFNSVLRDPLGLDRYGVTSKTYGGTKKSNPDLTESGIVAAGYTGLTGTISDALISAGYSIAYSPGTAKGTTLNTTQGFSNYAYVINDDGNVDTKSITQVNKGMITTYPFNVNTTAFGGTIDSNTSDSISTMTILQTHQQYYQANMNPEDVVVWYCLSGTDITGNNRSTYAFNDTTNAYYIFSNGNATYSGFGHTVENIQLEEAKLFVNSIIAAYRVKTFFPEVSFTDSTGKNTLDTFLIPADDAGILDATKSTDTSRYLYFTVSDSNVGKNKSVTAVISYGTTSGTELNVSIYDSVTNLAVTSSDSLVSGLAYYVKIDDVINALLGKGIEISEGGTKIYVTATTTVRDAAPSTTVPVTLRKLMLFDLS